MEKRHFFIDAELRWKDPKVLKIRSQASGLAG